MSVVVVNWKTPVRLTKLFCALARGKGLNHAIDQIVEKDKYPDSIVIDLGFAKAHLILNAHWLPSVFNRPHIFQRPKQYKTLLSLFGKAGIGTSRYDEWKTQRETVRPYFSRKTIIKSDADILDDVHALTEKWRVQGHTDDLYEDLKEFSILTMFKYTFGYDVSDCKDELKEHVDNLNAYLFSMLLNPLTLYTGKRAFISSKAQNAILFMYDFLENMTEGHQRKYQENHIISAILKSSGFYDAESADERLECKLQAFEEIWQIMGAGYETTASSLTWIIAELAQRPEYQSELRDEINNLLDNERPNSSNTSALIKQKHFMIEVLRLHPSLQTSIPRVATENAVIGDDYHIRIGEAVAIPILNVHKDKRWFENPDEFNPSRQASDARSLRPKTSQMSFLHGDHTCPGRPMFFQRGMLVVTEILKHFDMTLDGPPPTPVNKTTILPSEGCRLKFTEIDKPSTDHDHDIVRKALGIYASGEHTPQQRCPFH